MKRRDLERKLRIAGCYLKREGASHSLWVNPKDGSIEAVPRRSCSSTQRNKRTVGKENLEEPECRIDNRTIGSTGIRAKGRLSPVSQSVENITVKSISIKAIFVTAKRVKIEDGKSYRYRQVEWYIHSNRHAGDFIRQIIKVPNL